MHLCARNAQDYVEEAFGKIGLEAGVGRRVKNGVFTEVVKQEEIPPVEEQRRRIERATKELSNIDDEERERREKIGSAALLVTVVVGSALYVSGASSVTRFLAIWLPLNLSLGFLRSAESGL